MKIGFKTISFLGLATALLQAGCSSPHTSAAAKSTGPSAPAPPPAAAAPAQKAAATEAKTQPALTNLQDRVGYAIGLSVGNNLKRANFDVNLDEMMKGVKDALGGHEALMTEPQAQQAIMEYQRERQHEIAEANLKKGDAFLAENKTKEGVHAVQVKMPDGTTSEFQYKVLSEGTGEIPKSNDTVSVTYRGTLLDGTEFDSSARHGGQPAKFPVNHVIRGWTEALQLMKTGSKWQLFIPANLAYGERPSPTIPAGSTLIFDVELLGIDTPKPLTSDIIRVPSAEEMKAGAKIEVIKAEDAEKMAAAATNKAASDKK